MMIMMMMENFHWKFQPVGAPLPSLACDDQDYNHDDGDGDHDDEEDGENDDQDDNHDDENDEEDGGGNFNLLELRCPADQTF